MILGLYYLSIAREGQPGEGMVFGSIEEVDHALHAGIVNLHSKITARIEQIDENGETVLKRFETTPGRLRLGAAAAEELQDPVRHRQPPPAQEGGRRGHRHRLPPLRPEGVGDLLRPDHGPRLHRGVQGRHLLRQGRHGHPRRPSGRSSTRTRDQVKEFEQQYMDGLITQGEKYNKVVDAWSQAARTTSPTR